MSSQNRAGRERLPTENVEIYGAFLMAALSSLMEKPLKSKVNIENKNPYGEFATYAIHEPYLLGLLMGREVARVTVSERTFMGGFNRVDVFDSSLAGIVEESVSKLNEMYGLILKVHKRYKTPA